MAASKRPPSHAPSIPRDEPFPPPEELRGPTVGWALRVLCLWQQDGYPVLMGVPAEQIGEVRRLLGPMCP